MVIFSNYVLDKFLASGASTFEDAEIADMSSYCDQSPHWLNNNFLNSVLRLTCEEETRQYIVNFLRRAEGAFTMHALARAATYEFLSGSRQSMSLYMKAMLHWEQFLEQAWHAHALLVNLFDFKTIRGTKKIFTKGSPEQRLNHLYNLSKHAESAIENGQLPKDGTIPVWMDNEGLRSVDVVLTWGEIEDLLKEITRMAQILQDPLTMEEKLRALVRITSENQP